MILRLRLLWFLLRLIILIDPMVVIANVKYNTIYWLYVSVICYLYCHHMIR